MGAAGAAELAQLSPALGVAGAASALRLARPTGVARAAPLAVVTPILRRAGGAAICTEEAGFAAAQPRSHAHFVRPAGVLPFAERGCALPPFLLPARAARQAHGRAAHLADIPAVGVELLGRALHPQPQLQAEQQAGVRHPSGAASVHPSVRPCVPLLQLSLFLQPALVSSPLLLLSWSTMEFGVPQERRVPLVGLNPAGLQALLPLLAPSHCTSHRSFVSADAQETPFSFLSTASRGFPVWDLTRAPPTLCPSGPNSHHGSLGAPRASVPSPAPCMGYGTTMAVLGNSPQSPPSCLLGFSQHKDRAEVAVGTSSEKREPGLFFTPVPELGST